jgi:WD domain, G-beta repeat
VLSPLTAAQLHDVVRKPAENRGVAFQPGLVDLIVQDAVHGSLALLEFTLKELWPRQRHRELTHAAYKDMGRVSGALERFAERQLATLPTMAVDALDRLLLGLVRVVGDRQLTTRRRLRRSEVDAPGWAMLEQLARARLVVIDVERDEPSAELAHEALIFSWQRLDELVGQNEKFLSWLERIEQRAVEGDPLPESRIAEARDWLARRPDQIPAKVAGFVRASETVAEQRVRELSDARDRAERERAQADTERVRAERAARRAEALRLAAQSELALRSKRQATTHALALAIESLAAEPTLSGDSAIRHALRIAARPITRLDHDDRVVAVAFCPDGTRVATGSHDGSARVLDAASGAELARFDHDDMVVAVAFSPDGTCVATASYDRSARVFEAASGAELARPDHDAPVVAVAFCPDGTRVVTASRDGSARVFEAASGAELARFDHDDTVVAVAFSPDGTHVACASSDGSTRVFELQCDALMRRAAQTLTRPLSERERLRYGLAQDPVHVTLWQGPVDPNAD